MYMDHIFTRSSVSGRLDCLHVLAVVNSAAMNVGLNVSFWIRVLFRYIPRRGIAESFLVTLFLVFWGNSILFSIVAVLVCIPNNSVRGNPFSTPSPAFIACRLLNSSHSDWREMVPYCGFDLHFSDNEWCWASFHVFVRHLYVLFGEMSV